MNGANVHLEWAPSSGNVERHLLEVGSAAGMRDILVLPIGAPTTTLDAAAPPGRYFLRVRAANACGTSEPSSEIFIVIGSAATLPGAPPAPAVTVSGSDVHLSWSAPTTGTIATGYVLEAGLAPGLTNAARILLGVGLSLDVPAVPSGTYHVRVRAVNEAGIGPPSADTVVVVP